MHFTYILKCSKTGHYYYSSTSDIKRRLKNHNSGKVVSTKSGRLWEVHYWEAFATKEEALKRERFFKTIDGYRYLKENGIT
jgi:putative endonuclease